MKIKITLNEKSIKEAITAFNKAKSQLPVMKKEFYEKCCENITQLANKNLISWDIGENVKDDILNGWVYDVFENGAIIKNNAKKAVYVEFGTGIVGQEQPHPNSSNTNYEYNRESKYKDSEGRWTFYQNLFDLDLPTEYSDDRIYFHETRRNSERMLVRTSGAPASLFVFNAILEFKEKNLAKKIWEEIKVKYWG